MKKIKNIALVFAILATTTLFAQGKFELHTVAFYNFENLFDTINQENNDEEWLPNGAQNWTHRKYQQKLHRFE